MSGLDIGSAAVGFTSLGFTLLRCCIEAYQIIFNARNLGTAFNYLLCRLRLQEELLIVWAYRSGMSRGSLDSRLNAQLIDETLSTIQNLLSDSLSLREKYGLFPQSRSQSSSGDRPTTDRPTTDPTASTRPQSDSSGTRSNAHGHSSIRPDERLSFLDQDSIQRERGFILQTSERFSRTVSLRKKLQWGAIGKKEFEDLIYKIDPLIQRLRELLSDVQQVQLGEDWRLLVLQQVTRTENLEQSASMVDALSLGTRLSHDPTSEAQPTSDAQPASDAQRTSDTQPASDAQPTSDALPTSDTQPTSETQQTSDTQPTSDAPDAVLQAAASAAHLKSLGMCERGELRAWLSNRSRSEQPSLERGNSGLTDENLFDQSGLRGTAKFANTSVYVEFKSYDSSCMPWISDRVERLAYLLNAPKHPLFCTLTCQALLRDDEEQQFCLVYKWPSDPSIQPRSLLNYLSGSFKPSVTERIHLAKTLAGSLLLFHAAGWLHKGLRSANVLFFSATKTLQNPFIVGFDYSRRDGQEEVSEATEREFAQDIYRHPRCQGEPRERFHKLHDIYAFGLVLVEIAEWRPLERVFCKVVYARTTPRENSGPSKTEERSIKENYKDHIGDWASALVDQVDIAFKMGTIYRDVVHMCLACHFDIDRNGDKTGEKLLAAFFKNVVKKLESCII